MRPPLITFLTYNRLGYTAISLSSLLRTDSEFELYIMDNDSRDDTWQFLQDTKDPRIKSKIKWNQNMGVAHALNFALCYRKSDQAFINFENDFRIHNKDFVKDFEAYGREFPEIKAFSATTFPHQLQIIDKSISEDPTRLEIKNGRRLYYDTIMGFCTYFPAETMNILKYYDEVNCLLDMEVQARIGVNASDKKTGYAMDIRASHCNPHCESCLAYHNPCEQGEMKCMKYYSRVISEITKTLGFDQYRDDLRLREEGKKGLSCGSMFDEGTLTDQEKSGSTYILSLFKKFSEENYNKVDGK